MRKVILKETINESMYKYRKDQDENIYRSERSELSNLFVRHGGIYPQNNCTIPYFWMPKLLLTIKDIIKIDFRIIFNEIKEKHNSLVIDCIPTYDKKEIVNEEIIKLTIEIDRIIQQRVDSYLYYMSLMKEL